MKPRRVVRLPPTRYVESADATAHVPEVLVDPLISELAKQVRSLYCTCMREYTGDGAYGTRLMPQWDGDQTGNRGIRTTPVWPRIAQCIVRNNADPYQYIRAQFYAVRSTKPPAPNTLYSETAVSRYELFRDYAREEVKRRVESDDNQVRVHTLPLITNLSWSREKALDYVLRDLTKRISPLLRYCHAVAASLATADNYQHGAMTQYVFQVEEYDAILQQRIPDGLRTAAIDYRSRFVPST